MLAERLGVSAAAVNKLEHAERRGGITISKLAEVATAVVETPGQEVVVPIERPLKATGGLAILRGNLAPAGALIKAAAADPKLFEREGRAVVFESLDDLAASPRNGAAPVPLAHLSDAAKRNGSTEVNNTLSELFRPESSRALMVLDPRFHPGMNAVTIQVVPAKNVEEGSTYDLVQRETGPLRDSAGAHGAAGEAVITAPWDRTGLTNKDWLKILKNLEKHKERLEGPPPENHRERETYVVLRKLLLTDASARKAFLAVHWKGRPSGLPLLVQLLSQGTWIPEADTDGDYLEAELDHLSRQEGGQTTHEGDWTIGHGWTVTREIRPGAVRAYTARAPSAD